MGNRAQTEFFETDAYSEALDGLGKSDKRSYVRVVVKMEKYEAEYKASSPQSPVSKGFDAKPIDNQPGAYELIQIELTHEFRAAILFPNGRTDAWWIDRWKKTKMRNQRELKTAQRRASLAWDSEIRGGHV
jgi:hypothetical protein